GMSRLPLRSAAPALAPVHILQQPGPATEHGADRLSEHLADLRAGRRRQRRLPGRQPAEGRQRGRGERSVVPSGWPTGRAKHPAGRRAEPDQRPGQALPARGTGVEPGAISKLPEPRKLERRHQAGDVRTVLAPPSLAEEVFILVPALLGGAGEGGGYRPLTPTPPLPLEGGGRQ